MKISLRNIIPILILLISGSYMTYAQTLPLDSTLNLPTVPQTTETLNRSTSPRSPQSLDTLLQEFIGGQSTNTEKSPIVPPFEIIADPPSPSPGETVTITAQTPTFDKNTAEFLWNIDGKSRPDLSGFGKNSFTMTAGSVGSTINASVQARRVSGLAVRTSKIIYTTDVVFTWTTDTYIPKWYKGKALPVADSTLRIVAIPTVIINGATISPERLIYTWNIDGKRIAKNVGAQVLNYTAPKNIYNTQTIVLTIQDMNKRIEKEIRTGIQIREPKAVVYELLPLGGVEFRRGLSMFRFVPNGALDLQAEPFFYNTPTHKNLSYTWAINGETASSTPENPFLLTLNFQQGSQNDIPVSIEVNDKNEATPSSFMSLIIPYRP